MSQEDYNVYRQLKDMMAEGASLMDAAFSVGVSHQKATWLLARGRVTVAQTKERRKEYIVARHNDKKTRHRHTPHVIACYFMVDESHVLQLMRELRAEGRLPPLAIGDKEWQEDILKVLRRRYPQVYRAATVGKTEEKGDSIYVAGKGWMSWPDAEKLSLDPKYKPKKI